MAAGETYLSRFFVKFIEISAAGVATAVSGYVLAHLSGYLNGPPAAIQAPAALHVPAGNPAPAQIATFPLSMPIRPIPSIDLLSGLSRAIGLLSIYRRPNSRSISARSSAT